jgi:ABC-2 type transport system ATP-binding protein
VNVVPALAIEALSFSYADKPVLRDINLKLIPGEFCALLGPNGAGKSTLFALINNLLPLREGRIDLFGTPQHQWRALKHIGVVFQQQSLDADLSVRQNLQYYAGLHGMAGGLLTARIEQLLTSLDLLSQVHTSVRKLSGGMRRRVEIARALLPGPRLLLLDEVTTGLDIASRDSVVSLVHALAQQEQCAVLWATHLVDEIADDDRVVILAHGKLVADGTREQIGAGETLLQSYRRLTLEAAA